MSRTFGVSPVTSVTSSLPPETVRESLGARGILEPEALADVRRLVRVPALHGLLAAIHTAFAQHRPLSLAPDHVWLCITQAVARHVAGHAEALRARFVAHAGQKPLEIRRDLFVPGSPDNDWAGAVAELSTLLRGELGEKTHSVFVANSSTTDALARTASEVVLMGAVQRYFTFTVRTLCGIPSITLEGTPDDWRVLRAKVDWFDGIGLDVWLPALRGFLDQFVRASLGDPDEAFFRQLYKAEDSSGGTYVSGFVNTLFPYLGDAGTDSRDQNQLSYELTPKSRHAFECPKLDGFPSGLSSVPFTWKLMGGALPMSFVAGFVGVSQDGRTGALRPELGWAVTRRILDREFVLVEHPGGGLPTVSMKNPATLPSFEALARETAALKGFKLSFWFNPTLESLDGIAAVPNLEELSILGSPRLRTLESLAGHPGLRRVLVQQCDAFEDADALATLPALVDVQLAHLPRFTRFDVVAKLQKLEVLGLHGPNVPMRWVGQHTDGEVIRRIQAQIRG